MEQLIPTRGYVGQTFLSAGPGRFPAPGTTLAVEAEDSKVPRTGSLERLPYPLAVPNTLPQDGEPAELLGKTKETLFAP